MTSRFRRNPAMHVVEMDGELVMMGQQQGQYFGLREVAAAVWTHLEQPRTLDELSALVADEYGVAVDACRSDVAAFLDDLVANDLAHAEAPL